MGVDSIEAFSTFVKYIFNNLKLYGVNIGYAGYHHHVLSGATLGWDGTEQQTTIFFNYSKFLGKDASIIRMDIKRNGNYYNVYEGKFDVTETATTISLNNPFSDSPNLLATDELYISFQSDWGYTNWEQESINYLKSMHKK